MHFSKHHRYGPLCTILFLGIFNFVSLCTRKRARSTVHPCTGAGVSISGIIHEALWKFRHRASWDAKWRRALCLISVSWRGYIVVIHTPSGRAEKKYIQTTKYVSAEPSPNLNKPHGPTFRMSLHPSLLQAVIFAAAAAAEVSLRVHFVDLSFSLFSFFSAIFSRRSLLVFKIEWNRSRRIRDPKNFAREGNASKNCSAWNGGNGFFFE